MSLEYDASVSGLLFLLCDPPGSADFFLTAFQCLIPHLRPLFFVRPAPPALPLMGDFGGMRSPSRRNTDQSLNHMGASVKK